MEWSEGTVGGGWDGVKGEREEKCIIGEKRCR